MNNLFDGEDDTEENEYSDNHNVDNNRSNKGNENKKEKQLEYNNNHNTTELKFEKRKDFNEADVANFGQLEEILKSNSPLQQKLEEKHNKRLNKLLEL